jgi:hypothetical protein
VPPQPARVATWNKILSILAKVILVLSPPCNPAATFPNRNHLRPKFKSKFSGNGLCDCTLLSTGPWIKVRRRRRLSANFVLPYRNGGCISSNWILLDQAEERTQLFPFLLLPLSLFDRFFSPPLPLPDPVFFLLMYFSDDEAFRRRAVVVVRPLIRVARSLGIC